jgi:pyranose oxidase
MPTAMSTSTTYRSSSDSPHKVEQEEADVLIIGAGPIGCTYARKLIDANPDIKIIMIDAGAQLSKRPGEHLKNSFLYQRNVNLFASVIRGHLQTTSIPSDNSPVTTLDPGAYQVDRTKYSGFVSNNQNPAQSPYKNLEGFAVTYGVGGMATHWTCATPRHHPTVERMNFISPEEWDRLYTAGEKLLNTHNDQYEMSIRHTVVREVLKKTFSNLQDPYEVQSLPLAVQRRSDNDEFVTWSGSDTVLGNLADGPLDQFPLILLPQHRCTRLIPSADGKTIEAAEIEHLMAWQTTYIRAKTYVLAVNAVLTPQVLFNSGIRPRPLGRYLSEQPLAFCQVVLNQDIVDGIAHDPRFIEKVKKHQEANPKDPVPIPMNDPEPQVWIPVSEGRPWHCQIHRDAFNYGDFAPNVDSRLIVDLRWFGIVGQREDNWVTFSDETKDLFGMPQATFNFSLTDAERSSQHEMMQDMLNAATALGGFLPGSQPQFMPPGLPLHVHGTVRMGESSEDSVVDPYSKVWGIDNLYLGGNGLLSVATASNPTLTAVALAIRAAEQISNA